VGGDAVGFGSQGEGLGVVSWEGWLDVSWWFMLHIVVGWSRRTTTVRHNALLPHTLNTLFFDQSPQSMERSSGFEGTDSLLIFAFEEQSDFGVCICCGGIALDAVCVGGGFAGYIGPGGWTAMGFWF
jgi:hypothetical protein